jgi:hypothetical protein
VLEVLVDEGDPLLLTSGPALLEGVFAGNAEAHPLLGEFEADLQLGLEPLEGVLPCPQTPAEVSPGLGVPREAGLLRLLVGSAQRLLELLEVEIQDRLQFAQGLLRQGLGVH